jgi:hypothetical protein
MVFEGGRMPPFKVHVVALPSAQHLAGLSTAARKTLGGDPCMPIMIRKHGGCVAEVPLYVVCTQHVAKA